MEPVNINLELVSSFYDEIKIKEPKFFTHADKANLIQFVNELNYVIHKELLGPQGLKAAVSLYNKLRKVQKSYYAETTKQAEKAGGGVFI